MSIFSEDRLSLIPEALFLTITRNVLEWFLF